MLSIERENINYLKNISSSDLSKWLLAGNSLRPIWYNDDDTNAVRFISTYKKLLPDSQNKISNSITEAVSNWNPENYKIETLVDLSFIAALINNDEVIPHLVKYIDNKVVVPTEDDSFVRIVSSVCGSHKQEAEEALGRWYADDSFDWRCSGLICMGLVHYKPEKTEDYLPKLLKTIDGHPDYFFPEVIASFISYDTTPNALRLILKKFDFDSAKSMLKEISDKKKYSK